MNLVYVLLLLLPSPAGHGDEETVAPKWDATLAVDPDSSEADSSSFEDESFEDEALENEAFEVADSSSFEDESFEDEALENEAFEVADSSHAEAPAFTLPDSASSLESVPDAALAHKNPWGVSASLTGYFGTSHDPFAVPVLGVEYQGLYLEARYNYEDFETGSIFLGWHFEMGDEYLGADITPLFGTVFGAIDGVAPGLLLEMSLGRWVFLSELEYVVLREASSESFVYNHSELSYELYGGLSFGILAEHSKTLGGSNRDVVPGLLAGMEGGRLNAVFYLFYPDEDEVTGAIELAFDF